MCKTSPTGLWQWTMQTYIYNHTPNPTTEIASIDVMTRTRTPHHHLAALHTWGCPTYVLEPDLHDGKKIPCWQLGSRQSLFLGFSSKHASTVPIVLHNSSLHISPQFHVIFDDWFLTVISDVEIPDDPPDDWYDLFNNSRFQYVLDVETSLDLTDEWLTPDKLAQKHASEHSQQIQLDQIFLLLL